MDQTLQSSKRIKYFTWEEFDLAVQKVEKPIADSIYPIPRGGLIFAVALSHKFNLPIVSRPTRFSIFVDDIADSGKTILDYRIKYGNYPLYVLLKRYNCKQNAIYGDILFNDDWIVFPWENKLKAQEDYENYISGK